MTKAISTFEREMKDDTFREEFESLNKGLARGVIVQITNESHKWYRCLLVVEHGHSNGIMGYTVIPTNEGVPNGVAHIRISNLDYTVVGKAVIVDG